MCGERRTAGKPQLAFSADGSLAYVAGEDMSVTVPVWVDRRTGGGGTHTAAASTVRHISLSPEGTRLAMQINGTGSDVWLYDFARGVSPAKLTTGGTNMAPIWRPDGRRVTFASERAGERGIYEQVAGAAEPERIVAPTDARRGLWPNSWSSEGRLAFEASGLDTGSDVWVMPEGRVTRSRSFVRRPQTWGPAFSPDGPLHRVHLG